MHVFHKLILATSNLAEGASNMAGGTKHDLQWWKETALYFIWL